MRDPEGRLSFLERSVVRHLRSEQSASVEFLRSSLAREMVAANQLVAFEFTSATTIESPRLPFVSYPFEWCDSQLRSAGKLTLELSRRALEAHHELKDASAWNVIYRGARAVFCDHLSFQPIVRSEWWAFGQFARHFAFPLAVSRARSMRAHESFALYRDGLPSDRARNLLGARRFLSRVWPLLLRAKPDAHGAREAPRQPSKQHTLHGNLYKYCESLLAEGSRAPASSQWSGYTQSRQHYSEAASATKSSCIDGWVSRLQPGWVIDLGCNTGEFTRIAAARGSNVVAVDYDHDCIEQLFVGSGGSDRIHPVIGHMGDLSGGRGWCGGEYPGLLQRLDKSSDLVLMLALVHHLEISEGIPLEEIARLASRLTRSHAIVELIDGDDPMARHLSQQRNKAPSRRGTHEQLAAFAVHFDVLEQVTLPDTKRVLCLLRVKP
jgi:SAM-dependent methyltransferase